MASQYSRTDWKKTVFDLIFTVIDRQMEHN